MNIKIGNKFPHGIITQVIGPVSQLNNFYEYLLYTKSLNCSIQTFTKETLRRIKNRTNEEIIKDIANKHNIQTRSGDEFFIFTIDNDHSNDHDDALSWNEDKNILSIYISNVALIMDYLDLWSSFSNRVSSIYLPDRKRPMLPSVLSECLCSLNEHEFHLTFVLDIEFEKGSFNILNHKISTCNSYISKNYTYRDDMKSVVKHYTKIMQFFNVTKNCDVVHRSMTYFNKYIAKELSFNETGIFKNLRQVKDDSIPESLPVNIRTHIQV